MYSQMSSANSKTVKAVKSGNYEMFLYWVNIVCQALDMQEGPLNMPLPTISTQFDLKFNHDGHYSQTWLKSVQSISHNFYSLLSISKDFSFFGMIGVWRFRIEYYISDLYWLLLFVTTQGSLASDLEWIVSE